jgi:hypothetical protein
MIRQFIQSSQKHIYLESLYIYFFNFQRCDQTQAKIELRHGMLIKKLVLKLNLYKDNKNEFKINDSHHYY